MFAFPADRVHVAPRVGVQGEPASKGEWPSIDATTFKEPILKTFLYSNFTMQMY
jgi:hypothetical protein